MLAKSVAEEKNFAKEVRENLEVAHKSLTGVHGEMENLEKRSEGLQVELASAKAEIEKLKREAGREKGRRRQTERLRSVSRRKIKMGFLLGSCFISQLAFCQSLPPPFISASQRKHGKKKMVGMTFMHPDDPNDRIFIKGKAWVFQLKLSLFCNPGQEL
ncbi:hypothetical protein MRB53_012007 [Persea americana]|uniref:Uncharacterized protein n=1 Tax=Persea americana TaxID=3435 RepID=A0ACC2LWF3_PERAE|nr:hypothetical protein MRB53_012007 [Persea americana]